MAASGAESWQTASVPAALAAEPQTPASQCHSCCCHQPRKHMTPTPDQPHPHRLPAHPRRAEAWSGAAHVRMDGWKDGWMNDLDGWIMGCGIPQGQSGVGVAPQRESTLPWLLSLGWCLRSEELQGVVLIHHFPIPGFIPVYVAHLSGLGALSSVNGLIFITLRLFVYKNIYTVYCRNNGRSEIASESHN